MDALPGRELPDAADNASLASGPRHPWGLRMRFFDDGQRVRARLLLDDAWCGAQGSLLDGVAFVALDEAAAWCARERLGGAVAGDRDHHFVAQGAVKTGLPFFVEAWRVGPPMEDGWSRFQAHLRQEGDVRARLMNRFRAVVGDEPARLGPRGGP